METIADIMKMDREKQSQPINTAEVFAMAVFAVTYTVPMLYMAYIRSANS